MVSREVVVGSRYSMASSSLARELASALRVSFIRWLSKYALALSRLVSALSTAASDASFEAASAVALMASRRCCVWFM